MKKNLYELKKSSNKKWQKLKFEQLGIKFY